MSFQPLKARVFRAFSLINVSPLRVRCRKKKRKGERERAGAGREVVSENRKELPEPASV